MKIFRISGLLHFWFSLVIGVAPAMAGAQASTLSPAGASLAGLGRPVLDSTQCKELKKALAGGNLEVSADGHGGRSIFSKKIDFSDVLSGEFNWWLNLRRHPSPLDIGIASHETSHTLTKLATICAGKLKKAYVFGGHLYIGFPLAHFPNISVLDRESSSELVNMISSMRYQNYVLKSAKFGGNDFSVLVDELVAHTQGAIYELEFLVNQRIDSSKSRDVAYNTDIVGAAEIYLILLNYVKYIREFDNNAYSQLVSNGEMMCLIREVMLTVKGAIKVAQSLDSSLRRKFSIDQNSKLLKKIADDVALKELLPVRRTCLGGK
jgi:hypothetical protein